MLDEAGNIVHQCSPMAHTTLTKAVKTRVTADSNEKLEKIAASRELGVADIVREAIREYLNRNSRRRRAS